MSLESDNLRVVSPETRAALRPWLPSFMGGSGAWPTGLLKELLWACGIDEPKKERRTGVNPPKPPVEILEHLNRKAMRHLRNVELDREKIATMQGLLERVQRGERVLLPEDLIFIYLGPFASTKHIIEAHIEFFEEGMERERGKIAKHAGRRLGLMAKNPYQRQSQEPSYIVRSI